MAFKMKGSPMQRNFGISPMKDISRGPAIKGNHNYAHLMHDEGKGPDPHEEEKPAPKFKSALKQDEKYKHEDMYDVEQEMSSIQEDLEDSDEYLASQGLNREELEKKLSELTKQRDKIHSTLKGGNIKPGYNEEGERDKSKDKKYTQ
tara:strand:+ start:299 stop:739 length:441 start_codon:yes stop_codon:yes gene_type:complete